MCVYRYNAHTLLLISCAASLPVVVCFVVVVAVPALSVQEIEAQIGVESLAYLSWQGMLKATGQDTGTFCSACFTGDYPVEIPEMFKRSKLMLEKTPVNA